MATILLRNDLANSTRQIHLLCIGVGDYPYIATHQGDPNCPNLTNLVAPPYSTKRLAEYLVSAQSLLNLPVGSVEMVSSPNIQIDLGQGLKMTSDATRDGIQLAFDEWAKRCNWDSRNVALLYYCGHGLTAGLETLLLPHDFLLSTSDPFYKCIQFESTMTGMLTNQAQCQLYLVDACRTSPENYAPTYPNSPGSSLKALTPADMQKLKMKCSTAIYAAEPRQEAFGPSSPNSTPFVELVIEAINKGTCSDRGPANWFVSLKTLSDKAADLAVLKQRKSNTLLPTRTAKRDAIYFDYTLDQPIRDLATPPLVETTVFVPSGVVPSPSSSLVARESGTSTLISQVSMVAWRPMPGYGFIVEMVLPGGMIDFSIDDPSGTTSVIKRNIMVKPVETNFPF